MINRRIINTEIFLSIYSLQDRKKLYQAMQRPAFIWECPITNANIDCVCYGRTTTINGRLERDGSLVPEFSALLELIHKKIGINSCLV